MKKVTTAAGKTIFVKTANLTTGEVFQGKKENALWYISLSYIGAEKPVLIGGFNDEQAANNALLEIMM
jgi:hypothetical protein